MTDKEKLVQLGHGGGGTMQEELISFLTKNISIKKIKDGIGVDSYDDGATIPLDNYENDVVVTADGHTVFPLQFGGGDLGKLSVCGTVNDLIMMGATPVAMTNIVLIEEGTPFSLLGELIESFNKTAKEANIAILAGDSKVMPRGSLKDVVMNTTGIGLRPKNYIIRDSNCQVGGKIILTGSIGDHGAALIAKNEGIDMETTLESDVALLTPFLPIVEKYGGSDQIHAMKDPTRGGIASALNEWATKSNVGIIIDESKIIIKREVKGICGLLGLDPYEIANEGKALLCVAAAEADNILADIRATEIGKDAQIIGDVTAEKSKMVLLKTPLGGTRILEKPMGEVIPRIC